MSGLKCRAWAGGHVRGDGFPATGARGRLISKTTTRMLTKVSARAPVVRHIRRKRSGVLRPMRPPVVQSAWRGGAITGWPEGSGMRAAQGVGVGIVVSADAIPNVFMQRLIGLAAVTFGVHSRLFVLVPRRCTATNA